jgi:SAM-dependent methyltransferase
MHFSSYEHMQDIVARFLDVRRPLSVIDIGSYDVNGSYRPLFDLPQVQYRGIDLEAGPGVDIVLESPYRFPLASGSVDLIVSGQAFEHIEFFWVTWLEMDRVLKPGGMIFLIAPSRGSEHRYPQDCWRFYPDGYRALAKYTGSELLEVSTDWQPHPDVGSSEWGDTVGVFRKPYARPLRARAAGLLSRAACRLLTS